MEPKALCDSNAAVFVDLFDKAGISYDRFVRTTDQDHHGAVHAFWNTLVQKGSI